MTITINKPSRKMILAAAAALVLLMGALGFYLLSPNGYVSLDVNPSIVLRTNRLDDVTSVTGVNTEAQALLDGYKLRDRDLDDVIEDLVDRMILYGYLRSDSANDVLITVDDNTVSAEVEADVNNTIASYVTQRSLSANVMVQRVNVNEELLNRAGHLQVSAGKMNVIDSVVAANPSLVHADLAGARISDLVAYSQSSAAPQTAPNVTAPAAAAPGTTAPYVDTDYGPYSDGVTDYSAAVIGSDGSVTYVGDTDYGPNNDGVTDYNDTDYGPYNDGVTDYNDTDYGPNNDGVTDYYDTDYGPNNDGVTNYGGYSDYGSDYGSNYGSDYGSNYGSDYD